MIDCRSGLDKLTSVAVVGLGYVGLPLALALESAGLKVVGLDTSAAVVNSLRRGCSHVEDVDDAELAAALSGGFVPTMDASTSRQVDAVVICVPTPWCERSGPDLSHVESAVAEVTKNLRRGQLIVLESTTYPGTTDEVILPTLESTGLRVGVDFHLAFSSERIDPGNPESALGRTAKVVGGVTPACSQRAVELYSLICPAVVVARGTREAEMSKLIENTYRHVNIALVNELARFCHAMDVDVWDAIRCASTKHFGFQPFWPGPGVGGHCIPIDPNYLARRVRDVIGQPFRLVELAQEINAAAPGYVVQRVQAMLNDVGRAVRGSRILLVGVTYKANVSDLRETPATAIAAGLTAAGAIVGYHDPLVEHWCPTNTGPVKSRVSLEGALAESDLAVLLQAHREIDLRLLEGGPCHVLDTRGVLEGRNITRL